MLFVVVVMESKRRQQRQRRRRWELKVVAAAARAKLEALGVEAELETWGLRLGVQSEARSLRLGEAWNLGLGA